MKDICLTRMWRLGQENSYGQDDDTGHGMIYGTFDVLSMKFSRAAHNNP